MMSHWPIMDHNVTLTSDDNDVTLAYDDNATSCSSPVENTSLQTSSKLASSRPTILSSCPPPQMFIVCIIKSIKATGR